MDRGKVHVFIDNAGEPNVLCDPSLFLRLNGRGDFWEDLGNAIVKGEITAEISYPAGH